MSELTATVDIGPFTVLRHDPTPGYIGGSNITCRTCKGERYWPMGNWPSYGAVMFRPLDHDPHCPARNHVYLEGIGPMVEPRAMVFDQSRPRHVVVTGPGVCICDDCERERTKASK